MRQMSAFPERSLILVLKHRKEIQAFNDLPGSKGEYKSGIKKVIQHMISSEMIGTIPNESTVFEYGCNGVLYRVRKGLLPVCSIVMSNFIPGMCILYRTDL